ncbi:MAG: hypothetical protein JW809_02475, partial [Pirellulales bacterium]|nr:hypothetical protein [Pirellulales bacterium]
MSLISVRCSWYLRGLLVVLMLGSRGLADDPPAPESPPPPAAAPVPDEAIPAEAAKPAEEKPAEVKPAETTPSEAPPAEAKPAAPAETPKPQTPPTETPAPESSSPAEAPPAEPKPAEPRLRFNFQFQRWIDVLEWVAQQADLSLVLDAPPPGTFNFSDARDYTPTEAIDLLNSVLITKGYTLIHRGRMLVLVNLKDGIPEGLVPRVPADGLAERGRFEWVSVLFPLGRRDAQEVGTEIAPLLGPHGKAVPMAKTGQMMVTDAADNVRAIGTMIESIPEPPAPKKPEKPAPKEPAKPEVPVLTVYPITRADPAVAAEVLTKLLPDAKIALDEKANQINAYAVPSQQAVVKGVIDQMEAGNPPDKQPRLDVYPIDRRRDPDTAHMAFQAILPKALMGLDPKTGKLVVWATPADHAILRETLSKLDGGTTPATTRQMEVHPLEGGDPAATLSMLQTLLPDAQISLDATSRSLVALALPSEQQAIRSTLEQLRAGPSGGERQLRSYPLDEPGDATLVAGLKELAPRAQITLEPDGRRLVVVAAPKDHESIAAAVEEIGDRPSDRRRHFETYRLERADSASVLPTLQALVPEAKLSVDPRTTNIVAWATAKDHALVRAAIGQLGEEATGQFEPVMRMYPLVRPLAPTMMTGLAQVAPKAQITPEADGKRLVVVATESDHKRIRATLDQIESTAALVEPKKLVSYPVTAVQKKRFQAVLPSLTAELPGVQVIADAEPGVLSIWASPSEHQILGDVIKELLRDVPEVEEHRLVAYPLAKADPTSAMSVLSSLAPSAQLVLDPKTRRLAAWASPADHAKIKAAVEQLDGSVPADALETVKTYSIRQTNPQVAAQVLGALVPDASLTPDPAAKTIVARARAADHETLAKLIEEMESTADDKNRPRLEVYAAGEGNPQSIVSVLSGQFPTARLVADEVHNAVAVWATAPDHEILGEAIAKMAKPAVDASAPSLATYSFKKASAARVIPLVRAAAPKAQLTLGAHPNELIAWGRPADHKIIAEILAQLDKEEPDAAAPRIEVYPLEEISATQALPVLRQALPEVQFSPGADAKSVIVWAREAEHAEVKRLLETLNKPQPPEATPRPVVYTLRAITAAAAIRALAPAFPDVTFSAGDDPYQLVAMARSADHERLAKAVEAMTEETEDAPKLVVYHLESPLRPMAVAGLNQAFPHARFAIGTDPRQLVAWARPADHEKIKDLVEQLTKPEPVE